MKHECPQCGAGEFRLHESGCTFTHAATNKTNALGVQVGGGHYKHLKIQPVEYIHANNIPFIEGNIIKYATRWRDKGGVETLEKIKHYVDLLIELESKTDEPLEIPAFLRRQDPDVDRRGPHHPGKIYKGQKRRSTDF